MINRVDRIALSVTFFALTVCLAPAQQNHEVLAQVNGDKLTVADLEQKENNRLLQARYQYYQAEHKALDDLIDQRLLEQAAKREGITADQLLKREVDDKVKDPTEEQLQIYYEGLDSKESYSGARDKILGHIRQLRKTKARAAYIESLRSQAVIEIDLSPPIAEVALDNAPILGPRNAAVTLVEFADYQCPYCQKVSSELDKLRQEFGDKLALGYKDFPLPMHPYAQKAAEAARCAGVQGKFWEYHDLLYRDKKLEIANLKAQARALTLDTTNFDKCLDSGEQSAAVQKDLEEGKSLGLSGTPSFFVNGHFLSGVPEYSTLRDIVEQQLTASTLSSGKRVPQESLQR